MRHAKSLIDAQVWPEAAKKNHAETNAAKQKKTTKQLHSP